MKEHPLPSRPYMPGYGIRDKEEGLLSWDFVSERMRAARNYWVASTRPDGRPHAAPVWGVWHREAFFFSTGDEARKTRNLAANPAIVVHLESGDEVVILEGQVAVEEDEALLQELDQLYQQKYGVSMLGGGLIYRLQARKVFAWLEPDFPNTASRWHFD